MEMPTEVATALEFVRTTNPEVTQVLFLRNCNWLFMDEEGTPAVFEKLTDTTLLEKAVNAVYDTHQLPVVFSLPVEEEN